MDIQFNLDERIKIGEDACVVLPCVYKAKSMFILEECLYNYRYNPSSMTKNRSVYNLKEPKLIAKHLIKNINVQETWFKRQIYRSTVHRLFNRCISQFYQKNHSMIYVLFWIIVLMMFFIRSVLIKVIFL